MVIYNGQNKLKNKQYIEGVLKKNLESKIFTFLIRFFAYFFILIFINEYML